ncbi:MAG: COP23 domain-containing protein [Limnospira sp.]
MSKKTILQNLSIAGVAVSTALAFTSQPAAANTTFRCIPAGSGYATVAVASTGHQTKPLITWNSTAFLGSGYTPQRRCQEVSGRLTTAVTQNGGLLSSLLLTTGSVNGYDAVCWVNNNQSICNSNNLLVTISPGRSAGVFLANFLNRRANPYQEGVPGQENMRRTTVNFGEFVEQELEAAGANADSSQPPISDPDPWSNPNSEPDSSPPPII